MTKPRNTNELPPEVTSQMDSTLVKQYSQLSPDLSSRIARLVNTALPVRIHPNRIVKYAYLYARAEIQARGDNISAEHAVRSRHELEGALHSLPTGYRDQAEAQERYRRGRQARQHVGAALDGLIKKWTRVEQVVRIHRPNLPVHHQPRFSQENLARIHKLLHDMRRATILDDAWVREDNPQWPTLTNQTYLWWSLVLPRYRGKWRDMHQLAVVWRLSGAESQETFRNLVDRNCKKSTSVRYPFGKAWESILSEKP